MTHETQVIAHRGASHAAPENTVEAFRLAAELGADAVELDVRRSPDGRLLISHDVLPAKIPHDVPTLCEALDACAGMWVNVEIKNDAEESDFDAADAIAGETVAALLDRGEDHRWLISSFRMETIDRCRALAPTIPTAFLTVAVPDGIIDTLVLKGHRALHPWYGFATADVIAGAHARGVQVNAWTCDDPAAMLLLKEWDIDGICTNVPDLALATLQRN